MYLFSETVELCLRGGISGGLSVDAMADGYKTWKINQLFREYYDY